MPAEISDRNEAYQLLSSLGAPERLIVYVRLVGEAADLLMAQYREIGLDFDAEHIELGAAVHDAGKLLFPNELDGPGSQHEPAGEKLMLATVFSLTLRGAACRMPLGKSPGFRSRSGLSRWRTSFGRASAKKSWN